MRARRRRWRWRCPLPALPARAIPAEPASRDRVIRSLLTHGALSDSSDLSAPREGGEKERKKAPTALPSSHATDFLEEGPIPAWKPGWLGGSPQSLPAQPALLTGGKVVPRLCSSPPPRAPSFPLLSPSSSSSPPRSSSPQVLTELPDSARARAPSSSPPPPPPRPFSSATLRRRGGDAAEQQDACHRRGRSWENLGGVRLAYFCFLAPSLAAPGPRASTCRVPAPAAGPSGDAGGGAEAARAGVGAAGEPGRPGATRAPSPCPPPPPPLPGSSRCDTFKLAPPLPLS